MERTEKFGIVALSSVNLIARWVGVIQRTRCVCVCGSDIEVSAGAEHKYIGFGTELLWRSVLPLTGLVWIASVIAMNRNVADGSAFLFIVVGLDSIVWSLSLQGRIPLSHSPQRPGDNASFTMDACKQQKTNIPLCS